MVMKQFKMLWLSAGVDFVMGSKLSGDHRNSKMHRISIRWFIDLATLWPDVMSSHPPSRPTELSGGADKILNQITLILLNVPIISKLQWDAWQSRNSNERRARSGRVDLYTIGNRTERWKSGERILWVNGNMTFDGVSSS